MFGISPDRLSISPNEIEGIMANEKARVTSAALQREKMAQTAMLEQSGQASRMKIAKLNAQTSLEEQKLRNQLKTNEDEEKYIQAEATRQLNAETSMEELLVQQAGLTGRAESREAGLMKRYEEEPERALELFRGKEKIKREYQPEIPAGFEPEGMTRGGIRYGVPTTTTPSLEFQKKKYATSEQEKKDNTLINLFAEKWMGTKAKPKTWISEAEKSMAERDIKKLNELYQRWGQNFAYELKPYTRGLKPTAYQLVPKRAGATKFGITPQKGTTDYSNLWK